ncbi:MAG: S8 family serine peptidase, partial [Thermodesulfobacteriota bacterium]|nr:S8 family serine peptidase [Thermodesulfobacteriota bacterium]
MSFSSESFTYYSGGEEQDLEIYTERIALCVADGAMDQLIVWLETDPLVLQPPEIEDIGRKNLVLVSLIEGATEEQILELIERLNASGLVDYATPVFGNEDEMTLITDEFVVRFLDTYSVSEIEAYIASNNVTILERDFLWPKCYILGFTAQSGSNTLEVAREFYESGMVEFAHPNFITVMKPLWYPLLEEDFEEGFPQDCEAYDDNPADGRYYWGRVSSNDYPSEIDEFTDGDYKCWVSASHDPSSLPDLHPDDVADETYAPNMDAWLKFGPYDLSQSYWSYFKFISENDLSRDSPERFEWLVSVDNQNWHEAGEVAGYGARYAFYGNILCRLVPDFGNIDGADQVWFALRFTSDESTTGYPDEENEQLGGIFVDDLRLMVSNTEPVPAITTDEFSPRQWALHNVGQSGGDPGWDINILPAWAYLDEALGGLSFEAEDSIIVAVLDEGVDLAHEDLNLVEGYDATYDSEDPERVDSHGGPNPWDGHGTACAGIVGAIQNQIGIVGVAPGVKIMPVRIAFSQEGSTHWTTSDDEIADGILWAANNGAKVLSNSWGGGQFTDIKQHAIDDAKDMGCTLVFAAGNSNFYSVIFPARYEEVIAVGAMSPCGERKSGHSWGHETSCDGEWFWGSNYDPNLDIMAPGVMIPTCDITGDGGYAVDDAHGHSKNYFMSFNGTSSATPHVAGIAALMLTVTPDLTPDNVQDILQNFARDLGEPGFDEETGYGLVDAHAAVMEAYRYGDLSFSQCTVPSPAVVGQTISAACRVENSAPVPAGPLWVRVYFSEDGLVDDHDIVVKEIATTINPGGNDLDLSSMIPAETVPGWYSLIISVDDDGEVAETDETNNTFTTALQVVETAC